MADQALRRSNMIVEHELPGDAAKVSSGKRRILENIAESEVNDPKSNPDKTAIRTKEERQARKEKPVGKTDSRDTKAEGPEVGKPSGMAHAYAEKHRTKTEKSRKGWRGAVGEAYRDLERSVGQGRRDGYVSDRAAGHFARQMVKTPRYVKSVGSTAVMAYRNVRYLSKLQTDVKTGALTGREARIASLRRGSDTLKEAGHAALSKIGREASDFYGSDDLGIEAVRKPKDVIVNGYRTLQASSAAVKAVSKAPQNAKKAIKRSIQAAKQVAEYAATAAKTTGKALSNPVVLKSLLIGVVALLASVMMMAVVSSISSVFASFTLTSNDEELTKTYDWMTELDADLNLQIAKIEDEIPYMGVEQFHYKLNGNAVGLADMRVMTNTDYFLNYLDVRYKEYTLDGMIKIFGSTVRNEVSSIHQMLYVVTRTSWEERIPRITVFTDPLGIEHEIPWTEVIDHLDVSMTTIPIETYVEANKTTLFNAGQEEQYQALNEVGGMNLRQELGNPFPGYDWADNLSVTTRFGWRVHPIDRVKKHHDGVDIGQSEGTPIQAVMGGTVTDVVISNEGYGNRILIKSGDRSNLYAHCKDILVTSGQVIRRGAVIGTVGNTGASTDPHLHLEYEKDGTLMNPAFFVATD